MRPQCALLFFTCLTPGDFTCQWLGSAAKWVNSLLLNLFDPLTG